MVDTVMFNPEFLGFYVSFSVWVIDFLGIVINGYLVFDDVQGIHG